MTTRCGTEDVESFCAAPPSRRQGGAIVQLILTAALILGIATAGTVISVGFARAQTLTGISEPDTSLVIGMLAAAIALMSILSALAVRFIGRPPHR